MKIHIYIILCMHAIWLQTYPCLHKYTLGRIHKRDQDQVRPKNQLKFSIKTVNLAQLELDPFVNTNPCLHLQISTSPLAGYARTFQHHL